MRDYLRIRGVGEHGVALYAVGDRPVDLCIDGRRVWTFWSRRDTEGGLGPVRRAPWPRPLVRHLNGRSRIRVQDSATGRVYFDDVVVLGEGNEPIRVRNRHGVELGMDKSGKLVPTFGTRSEGDIEALLDATEAVIEALRRVGAEPFLAYGTLLGAVREGSVLAHDSDADLGYVSRFTDPVDVARESYRMQRELNRQGWRTSRYSGAAFKVSVTVAEVTIGLDVFGGFLDSGRLYLMGEIGTDFRPEWIHPLGRAELHGRPMPVPARPDRLLEATYGPGWRVPDPAFKFITPTRTVRALDEWFRGNQPGIRFWERKAALAADARLRRPSALARHARQLARELDAEVVDVGAGRGADSLWLAQQGLRVTAYDYVPRLLDRARAIADSEGADLAVRTLNLTDSRSVFVEGAALAHDPRPRVVLARHVLDATSGVGRAALARLCSMALREGGRLLAEFHLAEELEEDRRPEWLVGEIDVDALTTLFRDAGALRVTTARSPHPPRPTVTLVGEW